jgi:presenilin 1
MGFSGFTIFFFLGGVVLVQVIQALAIPLDWISFVFILYNFAMVRSPFSRSPRQSAVHNSAQPSLRRAASRQVGVLSVFFLPMPMVLKQGYLVCIGTLTAFWFTKLPEWTTWMMLVMMAVYDLFAVLCPGGPLKARARATPAESLSGQRRSRGSSSRPQPGRRTERAGPLDAPGARCWWSWRRSATRTSPRWSTSPGP